MSQKNETVALFLSLIFTSGIIAGGYWWFIKKGNINLINNSQTNVSETKENNPFPIPEKITVGTTIKIDGSTSMVTINERLKEAFVKKFPDTRILTQARGSMEGIISLEEGTIDLAAVSRPLEIKEKALNFQAIPVTKDAISIMVGFDNPICKYGLKEKQVKDIFQGKVTDWSQLNRKSGLIQVINRPPISGTHQTFKELILKGENFGITNNIKIQNRDETTGIIQELGKDGISYATYKQVINQSKACALPINGVLPQANNYPYLRTLFYVYKAPPNEGVKAFLGFLKSPEAQNILSE